MDRTSRPRNLPRGLSLADLRTPIVENFLSILPMGHEKALKNAFYNVLALVISTFVILAFWTVYCILEPFFKPLLWALLVGSVLHPFKANLSSWTRSWLKQVKQSSNPFAFHLLTTPFRMADSLSEQIGNYAWTFRKSILGGVVLFFVTYLLYYNPPIRVAYFFQWIVASIFLSFHWLVSWVNWQMIVTLNVVYIGYIIHYMFTWDISQKEFSSNLNVTSSENKTQDGDEIDQKIEQTKDDSKNSETLHTSTQFQDSKFPKTLSYLNWTMTLLFLSLELPYPIVVTFLLFVMLGVVTYLRGQPTASKYTIPTISRYAYMMVLNIGSGQTQSSLDSNVGSGEGISQILSPRHDKNGVPSTEGDSPLLNSTNCPGAESTFSEKKLLRSWSEGSGHSDLSKPFEQQLGSDDVVDEISSKSMPSPIYNTEVDSNGGIHETHHLIDSNKFLYGVLCACLVVQVWNRLWLLHLLPIPVAYYGIKKLCSKIGIADYFNKKATKPFLQFYQDMKNPHSQQLFPTPFRFCINIFMEADKKIVSICETYLDPVMAALVLVMVVIATILGLIFAAIQVYGEGDHLVRVSVNLINTTVSQYPEINNVLPEGWEGIMDSMVGNAYIHGREYITNMIRDSVEEKNPEKAEQIERQVIELWDRIYMAWNHTWDNAAIRPHGLNGDTIPGQGIEWEELLESGKEMPRLLEISVFANYAKANVGTIWSIMESLWNVLIGNISLVISAVTAVISLLFGGGTAILNLILNLVVFFTALFYLLSSKSLTYKPVELFNRYTPGTGSHAKNFATAVEEAVNGVFTASFKMSAFYGMWTWLIHTLFEVNIVFIPSIFGAIFGAVPILGPYWAAFPAVLELWLIQGHWTKAILMLCATMAPMSVVDTQIYREIKGGGHPYLTGLAVAGGIFCFGFQGAIIGPLVLCCFFVAVKIGNSFLNEGSEVQGGPVSRRLYKGNETTRKNDTVSPSTFTPPSVQSPLSLM